MRFIFIKKRSLLRGFVAAVLLAAIAAGVYFTDAAKVFSNEAIHKMPICSVETEEKAVTITFDAAWGAANTRAILKTLEHYDICATYFVTGLWAEKYAEELGELAASGRVEIGTHSNTYPHMTKLTKKQTELELTTSVSILKGAAGHEISLFRAPYGEYSDALLSAAEACGLYSIGYDIDTLDSEGLSSYDITSRVLAQVKPGSIVRMSDDGKNTPEALPAIIQGLKNKGYSFKTVGNLIYKDDFSVGETGKQIRQTRR